MTNTILLKRSAVAAKVPTTSSLSVGELALNTNDGVLYTNYTPSGGAQTILPIGGNHTVSGDVTGSGSGNMSLTLATVNSNVGTFQGLTVNAKGLVTAATNMNYAPLASPALSGVPTAPTASVGVTSTQIATCAFVANGIANGSIIPYNASGAMTGVKSFVGSGTTTSSGTFSITFTGITFTTAPFCVAVAIGTSNSSVTNAVWATITSLTTTTVSGIVVDPTGILVGGYSAAFVGAGIVVKIFAIGN